MAIQELFASNLTLGERVCILGPGPNGRDYHHQIPVGFTVLALNKAIFATGVAIDYWLINHTHQEWFQEADQYWKGSRIYRLEAAAPFLENATQAAPWFYYDPPPEKLDPARPELIDQGVRHGGTIAATALQIAWLLGAKEIWLCGIDMTGYGYWDGTLNHEHEQFHGEHWTAIPQIESLIQYLQDQKGVLIKSLSPTKLKVPMVDPDSSD